MKVTILGSTGGLGTQCLQQSINAGHEVTVLVRTPEKLPEHVKHKITVVEGDALVLGDVLRATPQGTDAVLFAIGVDEKTSPQNLCTDVTKNLLEAMRKNSVTRLVWCGAGTSFQQQDAITFGAKFVRWFAANFMKHRHSDKENQLQLLESVEDINWMGVRPLQMNAGVKRSLYRLGYNAFGASSKITFADCAHAMVNMLDDDTWVGKAPIIQY